MTTSPAEVRRQLRALGLRPRKALGQHFLVDAAALDTITRAAELSQSDTVVEVGPGLGVLTDRLVSAGVALIAVEADRALAALLRSRIQGRSRVTLIEGDILSLAPGQILARGNARSPYKVVANLPYNIATAVVRHFLEGKPSPTLLVLTVQQEVAEAMAAPPGAMSVLSVAVQVYSEPELVADLPPASFYPAPKVWSTVVRLRPRPRAAVVPEDTPGFMAVVNQAFVAPRKQLRNSLARGFGIIPAEAERWLDGCGIDPRRRAETLTLEEWERLYRGRPA